VFSAVASPSTGEIRWLAWCFGSASRKLSRLATHPRFGLLSALNFMVAEPDDGANDLDVDSIDVGTESDDLRTSSGKLRLLEYRTVAPYVQQTAHHAARDIPIGGFRFEETSDLVARVGGKTGIDEFPDVQGGRTIRFKSSVTAPQQFNDLGELLVTQFESDRYRARYPWADYITLVEDSTMIVRLTAEVEAAILGDPPSPTLDILLPDDLTAVDDERTIEYIAYPGEGKKKASHRILTIRKAHEYVAKRVEGDDADISSVLRTSLRMLDHDHEELASTTLLECLSADVTLDDLHYILYEGSFYVIERSFLERVDGALAQVPHSAIDFPCYPGGGEPGYNKLVAKNRPSDTVFLDTKGIYLEGQTPFESCDLLIAPNQFVHAKVKGQSSKFSHLCYQAANSAELITRVPEAREKLRARIEQADGAASTKAAALAGLEEGTFSAETMTVVIAILGDWHARGLNNLPLFSRIALAETVRRFSRVGCAFQVKLVDSCTASTSS
jgi:uncharacterized protein (TIGR04141 family)